MTFSYSSTRLKLNAIIHWDIQRYAPTTLSEQINLNNAKKHKKEKCTYIYIYNLDTRSLFGFSNKPLALAVQSRMHTQPHAPQLALQQTIDMM